MMFWVKNYQCPLLLSPVGLTGMYARRGEVQAAKAAEKNGYSLYYVDCFSLPD